MKNILLFSFAILFVTVSAKAQTTPIKLYNGIELPAEWPPRYAEPTEAKVMPVPYLQAKPNVIPINVGRQLFIDDFLIASTTMQRSMHAATYYQGNPILEPDKTWELTRDSAPYASPFSDGIWYDELTQTYKMWYLAGAGMLHKKSNQTFYTCYAESKDGVNWTKVNTDVYPNTNIVDTMDRDAATIWLDKAEVNPAKRYKMFNVYRRPTDRRWQFVLKYSADGIHWNQGVAQ
ncbi:MAG: hypothetical protein ACRC3G_01215, partial [Bacteroidales bacterium]